MQCKYCTALLVSDDELEDGICSSCCEEDDYLEDYTAPWDYEDEEDDEDLF